MSFYLYTKLFLFAIFGFLLRIFLMLSSYQNEIANRVEVSTAVNDWKRG